jgi:N-acyl-D-amino-acid deacylase
MHDLVIRNGTVVDGSGDPRRIADVAIDGGRITIVGEVPAQGRREIDATGLLVAPGWVDAHTHFDGQVMWDKMLTPSCWHGVTTAIMGNCGVGFAPVRPGGEARLIDIMEGVEDIPRATLTEGLKWGWESFPDYMDRIAESPMVMDVAAQLPHSAVRVYAMGDRGARNEPATPDDIERMCDILRESLAAGAIGFSTSRTMVHVDTSGRVVPGTFVDPQELLALGKVFKEAGHGVFELASDAVTQMPEGMSLDDEFDWMTALSRDSGVPISFPLVQPGDDAEGWRAIMARIEAANAQGAQLVAQFAPRAIGLIIGWDTTFHPFMGRPSYDEIGDLAFTERLVRLQDPAVRAAILAETSERTAFPGIPNRYEDMFELSRADGTLDYEPARDTSVKAQADRAGTAPDALLYDMLLRDNGNGYIYVPLLNYALDNLDVCREVMLHPAGMVSLSDAGAHCGAVCDASTPTFMLSFWTRDRTRGSRLTIEQAVAMQARRTAEVYGLLDRGLVKEGLKADINLIDHDKLRILAPELVNDLPAGGKRLLQRAEGYRATIVSGVVTFEDGVATGAMPGQLVRAGRQLAAIG